MQDVQRFLRESEVSSNLMIYTIVYLPLNCFNKEYVMIAISRIVTVRAACVRLRKDRINIAGEAG